MGAAPRIMEQRSSKSLQTTSPCYSNAKSALKVSLTFNKVEKTKLEISILFIFFLLLSSFFLAKHNPKSIVFSNFKHTKRLPIANLLHSYLFCALCDVRVVSYGLKTVPKSLCVLTRTLLGFSCNNCVGHTCLVLPWTTEHVQYRLVKV